jgi:DNA-binding IclR family transcriptional regulator
VRARQNFGWITSAFLTVIRAVSRLYHKPRLETAKMLSAIDLAKRLDLPVAKVEAALANLERLGLVRSVAAPSRS